MLNEKNLYWFERHENLLREKHDYRFFGTPNGFNHAVFNILALIPIIYFAWKTYHSLWILFLIWLGSIAFWMGIEFWQNYRGVKQGWERNKQWWNPFKWNASRHHDWIMPSIAPLSVVFILIGTLIYWEETMKIRHSQQNLYRNTGRGW